MAANTITRGRLRRLAELRPERGLVLSVFYNLDPSEFGTPAARATEVNSVVTAAAHKADEVDGLGARRAPGAPGRRRARARGAARARTSRPTARTGWPSTPAGPPTCSRSSRCRTRSSRARWSTDRPCVEPLVRNGSSERWCVLLVNRRDGADLHRHRRRARGGRPDRGRRPPPARPGRLVAEALPARDRAGEAQPPRQHARRRCSRASSATRSTTSSSARRRSWCARSRSGCTRTCARGSPGRIGVDVENSSVERRAGRRGRGRRPARRGRRARGAGPLQAGDRARRPRGLGSGRGDEGAREARVEILLLAEDFDAPELDAAVEQAITQSAQVLVDPPPRRPRDARRDRRRAALLVVARALVIVDFQNDFTPGGALGVPRRRRDRRADRGARALAASYDARRRDARLAPARPRLVRGAGRAVAAALRPGHAGRRAAPGARPRARRRRRRQGPGPGDRGLLRLRGDRPRRRCCASAASTTSRSSGSRRTTASRTRRSTRCATASASPSTRPRCAPVEVRPGDGERALEEHARGRRLDRLRGSARPPNAGSRRFSLSRCRPLPALAAGLAATLALAAPAAADQVIPDDLIVQGSVCAGPDCVNNESFGFDTLRLKGPVLRVGFSDTSSSAGFPTTDWELTANDADGAGAASYFAFGDVSAGAMPLRIEAGAPTDALARRGERRRAPRRRPARPAGRQHDDGGRGRRRRRRRRDRARIAPDRKLRVHGRPGEQQAARADGGRLQRRLRRGGGRRSGAGGRRGRRAGSGEAALRAGREPRRAGGPGRAQGRHRARRARRPRRARRSTTR